jgi:hypothetical protein
MVIQFYLYAGTNLYIYTEIVRVVILIIAKGQLQHIKKFGKIIRKHDEKLTKQKEIE